MASEALRAVNSILQYQQQREDRKVQEALALMQFGMQKRQADMKEAETRLASAEKGNQMFQLDIAKQWIPASGLEGIYASVPDSKGMDADEISDNIDELVGMLRHKDYGKFSETEATNIASAMWTFRNSQDPSSILSIANRFNSASSALMEDTATDEEVSFLNSFDKIKTDADLLGLSQSASKSLDNQYNITQEYLEFAEGDYDIQSNLGILNQSVQDEFDQQGMGVSDLVDSMEDDLVPDEEIEGEVIHQDKPKTNQEILDTLDYLSEDEKIDAKQKLDEMSAEIKSNEQLLSELIVKRDERLDLWSSLEDESVDIQKRVEYFKQTGQEDKINNELERLGTIAEQLRYEDDNQLYNEVRRDRQIKSVGYNPPSESSPAWSPYHYLGNAPSQNLGTYTDQIAEMKNSLQKLEQERSQFGKVRGYGWTARRGT
tara:strand:- start:10392 stop:11687 length:1296 start_codon:yes stop_codon:yes gene_type:complete